METSDADRAMYDAARQTLDQLGEDERAVRYPPLPRWFFPVMATLVAGLAFAQLLPPAQAHRTTLGLGVVILLVAARYWLNRDGVSWASARFSDSAPFLLAVVGAFALGWVASATTDAWWVWVVTAVVAGAIVLWTGRSYRRRRAG